MKPASLRTKLSRTLVDDVGPGVKFSRTLGNDDALLVITKTHRQVVEEGEERGDGGRRCVMERRRLEAGKSQCATLCGVLVFEGPLCYLISKVSVCVKVLLPLQQQRFPV